MLLIEIKYHDPDMYDLEDTHLPKYMSKGAAAIDLKAIDGALIPAGTSHMVHTGIHMHIGSVFGEGSDFAETAEEANELGIGLVGLIVPRSSLGNKGLIIGNTIGVIDADYQGEIMVNLWNRNSDGSINIQPGERIAQMVFVSILRPEFRTVQEFSVISDRGEKGFGSTGRL